MIRLCYSNATEELLAELVRALRAERAAQSPLQPVRLVVPNRNVESYLKLGLAEASGICANLEVTFLRRFLARIAERALPDARVVDVAETEGCLLAILHDPARLSAEALAPVRDYLRGGSGDGDAGAGHGSGAGDPSGADAVDRRRCQLAAELARLFDEYASSRPKMLAGWRARAAGDGGAEEPPTERWQRALWLEIFGARGLLAERSAREGIAFLPLADLLAAAERRLDAALLGGTLHLFGVSYVAESYHRMLAALGKQIDVRIYTLNPCREFWEDLESAGEAQRRSRKDPRRKLFPTRQEGRQPLLALDDDPFGLDSDAEVLPLRLWGRPGRENIRLLNQLTDADFESRFRRNGPPEGAGGGSARPEAGSPSLLHRLQDDILDRIARDRTGGSHLALTADSSLAVLPCPGLRRELEVVAAEIWRLVRADPSLRFNQIALIVPESRKAAYLSQIGAVFGESHDLPHSVIDLPLADAYGIGQAVEMLIDLPLGAFGRRELLPLLTHPAVLTPARFPGVVPSDWLRLVDELGVVHGADHRDHRDTYIEEDLFNWDQGVRRVVLGALMTGPRSGDDDPVRFDERDYLPAEPPPGERTGGLGFALLVRSLIADARLAAGVSGPRARPLRDWLELIRGMLTGYLTPSDDGEAAILARCLRAIAELEQVEAQLDGRAVSYRVAAELCRRRLQAVAGERGQHLARGVAVASFVPMRAIPFRALFLVGLGHGDFPAGARRAELDLRALRRLPGDVSPREQDLYMFLETLLCARERLVLSYVARDQLSGETLEPSSVILELRDILGRGYLDAAETAKLFDPQPPIPLRRHDDVGVAEPAGGGGARIEAHPLAGRERRARALGASLAERLPAGAPAPDLAALARLLPAPTFRAVAGSLGLHAPPPARGADADEAATVVVSLRELLQFLEDPLQGSARFRLRMREVEGDEERLDREDEPFETERPQRIRRLREAMLQALGRPAEAGGGPPDWRDVWAAYERLARRAELAGCAPTGAFRAAERPGDQAVLRTWWQEALEVGGGRAPRGRVLRFGRAAELEAADEIRDPILLDLEIDQPHDAVDGGVEAARAAAPPRRLRVQIVGRTELLVSQGCGSDGAGSLVFASRAAGDESKADRELLRAFFDQVALAAAGLADGPHQAWLAVADGQARPDARSPQGTIGGALERRSLAALDGPRARRYLGGLVRELLAGAVDPASGAPTGVHPYLLPHEAVFDARRRGGSIIESVENLCEQLIERNKGFSSVWGPVPHAVERHAPPSAEEAARMVQARFGLLFELLVGDDRPAEDSS